MKDNEMERLLAEFRKEKPSDLQVHKWKRAVRAENNRFLTKKSSFWMQMAAACVFGIALGAFFFQGNSPENDLGDATFEQVFIKS